MADSSPPRAKTRIALSRVEVADDRLRTVRELIAEAMMGDPGWTHISPREYVRRRLLNELVAMTMRIARQKDGHIWAAVDPSGREYAGLVWDLPESYPMELRDYTATVLAGGPFALAHPLVVLRALRMGLGIEKYFPQIPVAYLAFLGAHPGLPRCGAGRFLMNEVLEHHEQKGWDTYLETQNPLNVSYYAACGFSLTSHAEHTYPGGPPNWGMLRTLPVRKDASAT